MRNIFLVEDDKAIAKNLTLLLQSEGFKIIHASSKNEAVNVFKNNKFDLALVDISLPDVNGLDLCQYSRHIFLVFLSRFCNKIFIILWSHITNSAMNSFSVIPTFNILKY